MKMNAEDLKQLAVMFTGDSKIFNTKEEAIGTVISGAYMSDLHVDFVDSWRVTERPDPESPGDLIFSTLYRTFNAKTGGHYDVVVKISSRPSTGKWYVELVRDSEAIKNEIVLPF